MHLFPSTTTQFASSRDDWLIPLTSRPLSRRFQRIAVEMSAVYYLENEGVGGGKPANRTIGPKNSRRCATDLTFSVPDHRDLAPAASLLPGAGGRLLRGSRKSKALHA